MTYLKCLKGTKKPIRDLLESIPLNPLYISLKFFKEKDLNNFLKYNEECRNFRNFLIDYNQLELTYGLQNPSVSAINYLKKRNLQDFLDKTKEIHLRFTDEDLKIIEREGWSKTPSEIKILVDNPDKEKNIRLIEIVLQNTLQQNSKRQLEDWFSNVPVCNV